MNTRETVVAFSALGIMMLLSFVYIIGLLINLFFFINEVKPKDNELELVVIKVEPKVEVIQQPPVEVKSTKVEPTDKPKEVKKIDDNTYLLAQIIHAEAKGEPYEGKVAVGNVVMNRVNHNGFPNTIREVIFQKGQFSPVNNGTIYNKPSDDALKAAKDVMNGKKVVADHAVYFYNPDISTSKWIFTRNVIKEIGNHAFAS